MSIYIRRPICAHSLKVDRLEEMLGSYGPNKEPYGKNFATGTSPSGVLARSGTYHATSRVVDDDGTVHAGAYSSAPHFYP